MGKTYFMSGDDGDTVYLLPSIKVKGGGHLRLTPSECLVRAGYTPGKAESLATLIRLQPYILSCEYCTQEERDDILRGGTGTNCDGFRRFYKGGPNIIDWLADYLGVGHIGYDPWLTVPDPKAVAPVVMHRSPRYHNDLFPWWDIPKGFEGKIVMVGSKDEHETFCSKYGHVPYHPTKDFLELAQVIAGSKLFIGNQSAPMAVALGLGVRLVQEVCTWTPNCRLYGRENAQFISHFRDVMWPDC